MYKMYIIIWKCNYVDIREIMKANTYDAKVNKNITINGLENVSTVNLSTGEVDNPVSGTTPTTED